MGLVSSALMAEFMESCGCYADPEEAEALMKHGPRKGGKLWRAQGNILFGWLDSCGQVSCMNPVCVPDPGQRFPHCEHISDKEALAARRELLVRELFRLHDLNKNGVLEELELIKLNEKIAMLHYGKDTDKASVRQKYTELFRAKLDPRGEPVPYETFRTYMLELLDTLDNDPRAQELIVEQFIAEARSGRMCFRCKSFESTTDAPFLSKIDLVDAPLADSPSATRTRGRCGN
eukprot:TRINITY_DN18969_c0_g1_i1.p2 TRINITY_DN18969_c0_g1~~TRINITY_DN18969_c0_g1_i1.p2  ORF type:complete len:233 (-),score=52.25 TRINITY_DN18969_c0_g1_i1:236-934(-)